MAINRQSAEFLCGMAKESKPDMKQPPQRGTKPGREEPSVGAAPQRGTRPGGVLGNTGLAGIDVTELFSPERVSSTCKAFGLEPSSAMDIKTGYDFDPALVAGK